MICSTMWGIDLSHTAHTGAQTGIQHVCRDLMRCFSDQGLAFPVIYDRYARAWRQPDRRENKYIFPDPAVRPTSKRSGKWSRWQKFRGRWALLTGKSYPPVPCDLLFCPELFDEKRNDAIFTGNWVPGMKRVAYFYDAIPLKHPDQTPAKTVDRYPAYLTALARFDHVACISRASERDLQECWADLGIKKTPPTSPVPLGIPLQRMVNNALRKEPGNSNPVILMVGTLEARKNHLAVLEACQLLWEKGTRFQLRLIGMLNRETGEPAAKRIRQLQEAGHPLVWEGPVSNERLSKAYAEADLFLYPSLYEGFGLPVLEALAHGLPTIATKRGALAELVTGGGCFVCEEKPEGIARSLDLVLSDDSLRTRLQEEAANRQIRSIQDTTSDLVALFQGLTGNPNS